MTKIDTDIIHAEEGCRDSFTVHPDATLAWCCHHGVELEILTETPANRIAYILQYKQKSEQVTRLNNFRPFLSPLPEEWKKAYDECVDTWMERNKAFLLWNGTYSEWKDAFNTNSKSDETYLKNKEYFKASAEWHKANNKYVDATDDWNQILHTSSTLIAELHNKDVPGHTWDGESIFKQERYEEA